MRVLVACEKSGIVREAFRKRGHDAWSCDIFPSDDESKHHYQMDIFELLRGQEAIPVKWDLMIAHPPCQYLTCTANRVFKCNPERWEKRLYAVKFVWELYKADIPKIVIENPVGVLSSYIRKPDQYIHPYQYGHRDSKKTGLWLKNLPLLKPTKIVEPEWVYPKTGSGKRMSKTHAMNPSSKYNKNADIRSKTYQGIANAMAKQWG